MTDPVDQVEANSPLETPSGDSEAQAEAPIEEAATPSLQDQLDVALAEKAELWDRCLRTQADLENYRKRVQREREEDRKYAGLSLIRDLLPSLDNLQRAVETCQKLSPEEGSPAAGLLQGVEMVQAQLVAILAQHGAKPIAALGQPFDPQLHEALQQVPSAEHPPMTVILEYESGFVLHERVIRPAKVIVSVAPPA